MNHALIIEDNMAIGRALQDRLSAFGFDSFDLAWTEQQARRAAARHRPDLVVIGDRLGSGSPRDLASEVAATSQAPILALQTDCFMLEHTRPSGRGIEGPYPLSELDAVHLR